MAGEKQQCWLFSLQFHDHTPEVHLFCCQVIRVHSPSPFTLSGHNLILSPSLLRASILVSHPHSQMRTLIPTSLRKKKSDKNSHKHSRSRLSTYPRWCLECSAFTLFPWMNCPGSCPRQAFPFVSQCHLLLPPQYFPQNSFLFLLYRVPSFYWIIPISI